MSLLQRIRETPAFMSGPKEALYLYAASLVTNFLLFHSAHRHSVVTVAIYHPKVLMQLKSKSH